MHPATQRTVRVRGTPPAARRRVRVGWVHRTPTWVSPSIVFCMAILILSMEAPATGACTGPSCGGRPCVRCDLAELGARAIAPGCGGETSADGPDDGPGTGDFYLRSVTFTLIDSVRLLLTESIFVPTVPTSARPETEYRKKAASLERKEKKEADPNRNATRKVQVQVSGRPSSGEDRDRHTTRRSLGPANRYRIRDGPKWLRARSAAGMGGPTHPIPTQIGRDAEQVVTDGTNAPQMNMKPEGTPNTRLDQTHDLFVLPIPTVPPCSKCASSRPRSVRHAARGAVRSRVLGLSLTCYAWPDLGSRRGRRGRLRPPQTGRVLSGRHPRRRHRRHPPLEAAVARLEACLAHLVGHRVLVASSSLVRVGR